MDLDKYQQLAKRTLNSDLSQEKTILMCCLGLAGETGETVDMIKKWVFHGHTLDIADLNKELGDVLWYVAGIATSLGLSLNDIADKNVDKLKKRYPEGFSEEASQNRIEYREMSK